MNQSEFEALFSKCKDHIEDKDWAALKHAIGRSPSLRGYSDGDDSLLFHARDLDSAAVRETVCCGVSPNICYTDGTTILMEYASLGDLEMVQFLLRNGADVNAVASCGETAFSWSCFSDQLACAQEVHAHGGTWDSPFETPLELAQNSDASQELIAWLKTVFE